jgi:hypothetical protein
MGEFVFYQSEVLVTFDFIIIKNRFFPLSLISQILVFLKIPFQSYHFIFLFSSKSIVTQATYYVEKAFIIDFKEYLFIVRVFRVFIFCLDYLFCLTFSPFLLNFNFIFQEL